jgi:hypothetical protein
MWLPALCNIEGIQCVSLLYTMFLVGWQCLYFDEFWVFRPKADDLRTLYIPGTHSKNSVFHVSCFCLVLFLCGLGSDHHSRCEQSMLSIWYIPLRSQDKDWEGVKVGVGPVALLTAYAYVLLSSLSLSHSSSLPTSLNLFVSNQCVVVKICFQDIITNSCVWLGTQERDNVLSL